MMMENLATPPPPKANPVLRGHEDSEALLREAYVSGRMHHAWLITGPKGVGKATLAYRFARFVLAHSQRDDLPTSLSISPDHPVFRRIAAGGHADFLAIERRVNEKTGKLKTVIDVDSVRALGGLMQHTTAEGGWRIVIIDCADEMNSNAANAVLKVLEEPPRNALFLLVSHNPGRLLPTIRSRCRTLSVRPLSRDLIVDLLHLYAPDVSQEDARHLAELSDGSIGRALALIEEGGLELHAELQDLLRTLPDLNIRALHALGDKVARVGADDAFRTVLELLRWWMERMILLAAGKRPTAAQEFDTDFMTSLAAQASLDRWFEVWDKINHLAACTNNLHLDRKQVVLNAFLGLENTVRPPVN